MENNEKIGIIAFILALICLSAIYNLSTTTTATGGITYYYVSSGTLVNGTLISGNIAALNESNGSVLIIRESTGQPGYNVQFSFKNVQRFNALSEISYYLGSTTHYRFIELYDFYSNAWTIYNSDYGQPNYTSNYIYVSNYTKHIASNGSVFVRYYHPVTGSTVHYLILDQLLLVDSYSVVALTENNISNTYNNYTTINNYTNITQGAGGVSFNGATVNLNGSLLINGTFSNLNDTKVNKSGDTMTGDFINASVFGGMALNANGRYAFPYSADTNNGLIAEWKAVDFTGWGINLMSLSNGIWFNLSCGVGDGYGGGLGYCWQYGKNQTPKRAAMAFQFVNDGFAYYNWDANINKTKLNINNETDHTQGYYKRMDFSNDLKIYYGNITVSKQAGIGYRPACFAPTGELALCP